MLFINTRPKNRAEHLSQFLKAQHYTVIDLPLIELVERPCSDDLKQLYSQLTQMQIIIVVSPTAAALGLKHWLALGGQIAQIQSLEWIAVGQATADYLAKYNINAQVPIVENSEGVLQLKLFQQHKDLMHVAFWRGVGGREFMQQYLQDQGAQVYNFILYQRQCPPTILQQWSYIQAQLLIDSPVCVLISSEASWENWLDLLHSAPTKTIQCVYIVLGTRLLQLLMDYRQETAAAYQVCCINDLKPASILAQLQGIKGRL